MNLLDTDTINHLCDGKIDIEDIPNNGQLYVTHLQLQEILKTKNIERRELLLSYFKLLPKSYLPTTAFVIGISAVGQAAIGEGRLYRMILDDLNQMKRPKTMANTIDVLLCETAILNNMLFITGENALVTLMKNMKEKCLRSNTRKKYKLITYVNFKTLSTNCFDSNRRSSNYQS